MKEELYKWYPIVGEGEYWLNADANPLDDTPIRTIVTNGRFLWTYEDCKIEKFCNKWWIAIFGE